MLKVIGVRSDGTKFLCFYFNGDEQVAVICGIVHCARLGIEVYDVRAEAVGHAQTEA
jgi:hypothetical protein